MFAAQRFLYRLLSRPLCNLLVVRAVAATHRDSTYALFRQIMAQWGVSQLFTCRETDLRVTCKNGNMAVFKGLDDREKLKSITFPKGELTDIWVEEASQISQADFNQLDVRLRGRTAPKQMVLTFNPISAQHWLKARFFDQLDPRALVVKSTYRDNPFLDQAYRQTLESYRDTDPYYYAVYCLGEWGVLGQSIFDGKRLTQRLGELPGPVKQGEFTWQEPPGRPGHIAGESIRFLESPQGLAKIYREPCPGRSYVVGGDTAGEGSDFNVAQVLDRETGEQVCTLRGPMDEDLFARQLYCLGLYYNTALLAVEINFSTYPVRELERLGYPRQYRRMGEDSLTGRPRQSWGFRTTSATRPLLIAGLVELARDCPQRLNDGRPSRRCSASSAAAGAAPRPSRAPTTTASWPWASPGTPKTRSPSSPRSSPPSPSPATAKTSALQRAAAPAAALSHTPRALAAPPPAGRPPSPARVRGAGVRKSSLREPPASPLGPCPPLPMAV